MTRSFDRSWHDHREIGDPGPVRPVRKISGGKSPDRRQKSRNNARKGVSKPTILPSLFTPNRSKTDQSNCADPGANGVRGLLGTSRAGCRKNSAKTVTDAKSKHRAIDAIVSAKKTRTGACSGDPAAASVPFSSGWRPTTPR
jgi:hypothetical protein